MKILRLFLPQTFSREKENREIYVLFPQILLLNIDNPFSSFESSAYQPCIEIIDRQIDSMEGNIFITYINISTLIHTKYMSQTFKPKRKVEGCWGRGVDNKKRKREGRERRTFLLLSELASCCVVKALQPTAHTLSVQEILSPMLRFVLEWARRRRKQSPYKRLCVGWNNRFRLFVVLPSALSYSSICKLLCQSRLGPRPRSPPTSYRTNRIKHNRPQININIFPPFFF